MYTLLALQSRHSQRVLQVNLSKNKSFRIPLEQQNYQTSTREVQYEDLRILSKISVITVNAEQHKLLSESDSRHKANWSHVGYTPFKNYFERLVHSKATRNNGISVKLPKVRLEFGKKSFYYQGAKTFNNLPAELRSLDSRLKFKNKLRDYFS